MEVCITFFLYNVGCINRASIQKKQQNQNQPTNQLTKETTKNKRENIKKQTVDFQGCLKSDNF